MNNNNASPQIGGSMAQNEYVQELFSLLQENGKDTKGLSALIGQIEGMESFVKRAEDTISAMKNQLAEMKEVQNHPVKTTLQNTIKTLERKVVEVKEQLGELKTALVEGCKAAIQGFKEKGAAALNNLAQFFHIKSGLQSIDKSAEQTVQECDKAVANINAFATNYHTAGQGVRNMGRIITGREPVDQKRENGKLARVVAAPYKMMKSAMMGLKNAVGKAVTSLEGMEEKQATRQAERSAKPDLLGKIAHNKVLVEQRKLEAPAPERAKTAELAV